ncbi:MAG: tRNA (adenosine(37)-N6)-threonylcarbamoyltransferase complex ATPase subunit type 1 TsaE [Bradyrhizobiaceae bacterium]|nr:tRNA (adenosine(37)-N6)-threonylcarbamoyltransferase complex ATPase subunit type 1 TsaE [Bradyrhizobiaceae bacterium]
MNEEVVRTNSRDETILQGEQFAARLLKGDLVVLSGDLGAGKTEFVKGICHFLAVEDLVTSPTFTIINQYNGEMPSGDAVKVYHVDLYRIEKPEELLTIGFDDMVFAHDAIKLVEWPEQAQHHLPDTYWRVQIQQVDTDDSARDIHISKHSTIEANQQP